MGQHSLVLEREENAVSTSGKFAAIVAGVALTSGLGAVTGAAPANADSILDNIALCESGGNPSIVNGSGHGGLFQFDVSTWRSVGGVGLPQSASVAEQYKRAAMLMASRGTQPWLASQGCWGGKKVGSAKVVVQADAVAPKPTPYKRKVVVAPTTTTTDPVSTPIHDQVVASGGITPSSTNSYKVQHGNTLSQIAAAHGVTTQHLFNLNRHIVRNPDLIYTGQVLKLKV